MPERDGEGIQVGGKSRRHMSAELRAASPGL